jgi:hypothetical protein
MLQEYGYVYNVRRYGRSISSSAPNHVARADQLDADTGDILRQNLELYQSADFLRDSIYRATILCHCQCLQNPTMKNQKVSFLSKSSEQVRFELGMLGFEFRMFLVQSITRTESTETTSPWGLPWSAPGSPTS